MLASVPVQYWLLILVALWMIPAAGYAVRHVTDAPSTDRAWRSRGRFLFSLATIVALIGLALFIFTPLAAELAYSSWFKPVIITALAAFVASTVVTAVYHARTEPLIRGALGPYARAEQPRHYWASLAWNAAVAAGVITLAWMAWTGRI